MNILVIGKFSQDQFGFHISDTLREMGHNLFNYDPSLPVKFHENIVLRRVNQFYQLITNNLLMTASYRNLRRKKLYNIIVNNNLELIICTHDFLYPDEVKYIKQLTNASVVLWFPDPLSGFNKSLFMIAQYDYLFFKDPYIVNIIRDQYNKKNVFYLPECCNPKFHKNIVLHKSDKDKYGCDITTYGSPHSVRTLFFKQLLSYKYTIKIWGHHPPIWLTDNELKSLYTGTYVFNESKSKSVLAAKININTLLPSEIYSLNARAFEIAGIGGFQIIHSRSTLNDFFEEGKEIIGFNNFEELIEKINYFLENPIEREKIAKAGQQRAYKEHTYRNRLNSLIEIVNTKKNNF